MSMFKSRLFVFTLLLTFSIPAWSATIVIQNADGPGEGLNDPNPPGNANQKGNNPGTTLGQMRMNVLQAAGDVWGAKLGGTVTIVINAEFNDLFCAPFNGTLGQAGTSETRTGTAGSNPALSYPIALANALAGVDLNGGAAEITATFNSKLDTNDAGCLGLPGFTMVLMAANPSCCQGKRHQHRFSRLYCTNWRTASVLLLLQTSAAMAAGWAPVQSRTHSAQT